MEHHLYQIGHILIALAIVALVLIIYKKHNNRIQLSQDIKQEIIKGISLDTPNDKLQTNYVFVNAFIASMRHGHIVSLILKMFTSALCLLSMWASYQLGEGYFYVSLTVGIALFTWMFYTDLMLSKELTDYERTFLDSLAEFIED
ncbi:hypothetical protein [Oleiphilus sp. HI0086]|uniref:hypothetical protein n=1 Tax=Oleiphilus sp. HI0086 TaxID=1822260 RepID=UPI0007C2E7BF|nr:hypothetical protein [Oleiphilus sp. HI0086]KZZ35348.1 hypothetical protein A3756_15920 [Oleiphilus sp. HI0086]